MKTTGRTTGDRWGKWKRCGIARVERGEGLATYQESYRETWSCSSGRRTKKSTHRRSRLKESNGIVDGFDEGTQPRNEKEPSNERPALWDLEKSVLGK